MCKWGKDSNMIRCHKIGTRTQTHFSEVNPLVAYLAQRKTCGNLSPRLWVGTLTELQRIPCLVTTEANSCKNTSGETLTRITCVWSDALEQALRLAVSQSIFPTLPRWDRVDLSWRRTPENKRVANSLLCANLARSGPVGSQLVTHHTSACIILRLRLQGNTITHTRTKTYDTKRWPTSHTSLKRLPDGKSPPFLFTHTHNEDIHLNWQMWAVSQR